MPCERRQAKYLEIDRLVRPGPIGVENLFCTKTLSIKMINPRRMKIFYTRCVLYNRNSCSCLQTMMEIGEIWKRILSFWKKRWGTRKQNGYSRQDNIGFNGPSLPSHYRRRGRLTVRIARQILQLQ